MVTETRWPTKPKMFTISGLFQKKRVASECTGWMTSQRKEERTQEKWPSQRIPALSAGSDERTHSEMDSTSHPATATEARSPWQGFFQGTKPRSRARRPCTHLALSGVLAHMPSCVRAASLSPFGPSLVWPRLSPTLNAPARGFHLTFPQTPVLLPAEATAPTSLHFLLPAQVSS